MTPLFTVLIKKTFNVCNVDINRDTVIKLTYYNNKLQII